MHPLQSSYPQFPNQIQTQGQTSAIQQVPISNASIVNSNNMCANQGPSHSQPHPNAPRFPVHPNNSNNPLSNGNGNFASAQFFPMQNMQMGFPQAQFFPQNAVPQMHGHHHCNPQNLFMSQPNGQFFTNNRPQITNMPIGQFNFQNLPQHCNQISGLPHGQFPQQHQGFPQVNPFNIPPCMPQTLGYVNQGPQNVGLHMNPQPGMMNANQIANNAQSQNVGLQMNPQSGMMNGQHAQGNSLNGGHAQLPQAQNNMQSGVLGQVQGNNGKDNGSNVANINQRNPQQNDFTKNTRFQKSGIHPMKNSKGNFKSFKGIGPKDKGPRNPHLAKCNKQETSVESPSPRILPLNYSQDEIQKWRAERRKNHPSRSNTEKTESEIIEHDAQKRRQELKKILAKQAELGVEVAEIPKDYLLENQTEQNDVSNEKGKSRKRGGRRQKHDRSNNRFNKKQKMGNNKDSSSQRPQMIKKKPPSLLEKLLSGDINRDKSHLLQAFRFMVLNNFFGEYPKKALEFPFVKVKDMNASSKDEGNVNLSAIKKVENMDELVGGGDAENGEVICEEGKEENSEVEEGELTD